MGTAFSDDLRSARANQIVTQINTGVGPGSLLFYTADQPARGAAITTQTLLGTLAFAEPAGTVTAGVLTFNPLVNDDNADADGIAAWVRVLDGDGVFVMDMTVTDNTGAGPVKMPSTQVYAGGILHVTSMVLTEGNA
jgi:hypothetical protein